MGHFNAGIAQVKEVRQAHSEYRAIWKRKESFRLVVVVSGTISETWCARGFDHDAIAKALRDQYVLFCDGRGQKRATEKDAAT